MPKFRLEALEHRVYHVTYEVEAANADEAKKLIDSGNGDETRDRYERTDNREFTSVKKEEE
jgi:hypothetical protein